MAEARLALGLVVEEVGRVDERHRVLGLVRPALGLHHVRIDHQLSSGLDPIEVDAVGPQSVGRIAQLRGRHVERLADEEAARVEHERRLVLHEQRRVRALVQMVVSVGDDGNALAVGHHRRLAELVACQIALVAQVGRVADGKPAQCR